MTFQSLRRPSFCTQVSPLSGAYDDELLGVHSGLEFNASRQLGSEPVNAPKFRPGPESCARLPRAYPLLKSFGADARKNRDLTLAGHFGCKLALITSERPCTPCTVPGKLGSAKSSSTDSVEHLVSSCHTAKLVVPGCAPKFSCDYARAPVISVVTRASAGLVLRDAATLPLHPRSRSNCDHVGIRPWLYCTSGSVSPLVFYLIDSGYVHTSRLGA